MYYFKKLYAPFSSLLISSLLLLSLFSLLSAAQTPCDPHIHQPSEAEDPLGYRLRDDRCEGRYHVQDVSSFILYMASFTESFEDYTFNSDEKLTLKWTLPKEPQIKIQQVKLQANGLQSQLLYRMDTIRSKDETSYKWPMNILKDLSISRSGIGVVGWAICSIGKNNENRRNIYLPLQIRQQRDFEHPQTYRVVIWPGQELTRVYYSLAPMNDDGNYGDFIIKGKSLNRNYYPAEYGIAFDISKPKTSGVYYLRIHMNLSGGGSSSTEYWFYHAG